MPVDLSSFLSEKELGGLTETRVSYMDDILSASLSTGGAPRVKLRETNRYFETRGQIHSLIVGPFGTGKTVDLRNMAKTGEDCIQLKKYTEPAVVGTISRGGEFLPGVLKLAAGKAILIDEVQNLSSSARNCLLNLLESQTYERSLGYAIKGDLSITIPEGETDPEKVLFKVKVTDNYWKIIAKFSCICAGTHFYVKKTNDLAWLSRHVVMPLKTEMNDMFDLLRGKRGFNVKTYDYHPQPFDEYLKYLDAFQTLVESLKFVQVMRPDNYGFIPRCAMDMARFHLFLKHRTKDPIEEWEKVLDYVPLALFNYLKIGHLTYNHYTALKYLTVDGLTLKEAAAQMGISVRHMMRIRDDLTVKQLLME